MLKLSSIFELCVILKIHRIIDDMDLNQFTNILFYPRPNQWGLRGDPMLWTDFENHIRHFTKIPESIDDFKKELTTLYEKLVGQPPKNGATTFVERYKHIGMSSGVVSADYWINTAFPLLIDRYKTATLHQPS